MKLLNPYPDFTVEQIKFLSDNISVDITNHGHSTNVTYFGIHIDNPYFSNDCNEIDVKTQRVVKDILEHIVFLGLELRSYVEQKLFKYRGESVENTALEYIDNTRRKVISVMKSITNNNQRIWPTDVLSELNINEETEPHFYELYCMLMYGYINGFARINGKTIDSKFGIDQYVDAEVDLNSVNKALDFICQKWQDYVSKINNISNVSTHQKELLMKNKEL